MRPPPFLSAGAIATLATLSAVAFAQTPRSGPPATPPSPAPSATAPAAPPSMAPGSAPTSAPGQPPSAAPPSPDAAPPAPPQGPPPTSASPPGTVSPTPGAPPAGAPPAYGPPPGAPPPAPQAPIYGPPGYAQPGYPPPYYSSPYAVPPAPAVPLDAHSHTGFFLRMGIGGGYMANATTLEGPTFQGKVDAAGGAFTLEIDIGGALSPGIILAGSYTVHSVGNAKLTNDTRTYRPAHDPSLTMLAAMLDVYPDPRGGFHFGGALGFASLRVRDTDAQPNSGEQNGLGVAPHVGYEWWVGNYWGIGVLGRFIFARTQGDYGPDGKEKDTVTGGAILFSATYN